MNPNNYASLEASKRLVDAGIVLETEKFWWASPHRSRLIDYKPDDSELSQYVKEVSIFPAPSIAEVWMELLSNDLFDDAMMHHFLSLQIMKAGQPVSYEDILSDLASLTTDALIDLLIWAKQKRKEK